MDILEENLRIQKENYKEIMKEYEEKYLKEYKEEEQKKDFFERLVHTRDDMERQLEVINTDIDMLEHRRHQRDFRNQARILEARLDELNILVKDFQFSDNNFNYQLLDQVIKGKEAINNIDFDGKTQDELGQDKTVINHKKQQIGEVQNYYDDAIRRLDGIQGNIKTANTQLVELNKQIRAQNIKLLEMDDLIRETQSVLSRMTQLVEFFNKVFLKDKCMNLIIMLMILLCIGCVVLIFMEKSKSGASAEEPAAEDAAATAARVLAGVVWNNVSGSFSN